MKKFEVTDVPARFGEGALLGLTKDQLATRAHNVEILPDVSQTVEGVTLVRANRPLEFRTGEQLVVEGEDAIAAIVDPMTGQKQSSADRRRSGVKRKASSDKAGKAAPARKGR